MPPQCKPGSAFTLVELLVTIGIAAAVITAAVLAFGAFQRARETANLVAVVDIGSSLASTFYDLGSGSIQTWNAPSFGRRALAEEMRDVFLDDVAQSAAVFALARESHTVLRPTTITGVSIPAPDTPDAFRTALVNSDANADSIFSSSTTVLRRQDSSDDVPVNSTIFTISPSSPGSMNIRAIYEIDFVEIAADEDDSVPGIYASVRRYVGSSLTAFYDVFYPADETIDISGGLAETRNAPFSPVARYFSVAEAEVAEAEGSPWFDTGQRIQPFYFFWWPDPGVSRLKGDFLEEIFPTLDLDSISDQQRDYLNMGQRTAFFMVVPQFPSQ